jgi:hypothetical protein
VTNFYRQNNFIDYERVTRLQIGDAPSYLRRLFPDGIPLEQAWLDGTSLTALNATIEDAIITGGWISAIPLLPSGLSRSDAAMALRHCVTKLQAATSKVKKVIYHRFLVNVCPYMFGSHGLLIGFSCRSLVMSLV